MSVFERVQQRIKADEAFDALWPCDETEEGARADIAGEILKIAEHWQLKSQEHDAAEHYVHLRAIVCEQILDLLDEGLWPDTEAGG